MRVIIAGSREIIDYPALEQTIADAGWPIEEVVSGGCRGVDSMGEQWAESRKIPVRLFAADWAAHGRLAGELRNREMASHADGLILLWDGRSPGASCMLHEASKAGIRIHCQIYGHDMQQLAEIEEAILNHYWRHRGRLIHKDGYWQWEDASIDAPEVSEHAVNELVRKGLMEAVTQTVLVSRSNQTR
jgi:hypothetical protein